MSLCLQENDTLTLPLPEDSDELTLIAYLDGELDEKEKQHLEKRFANEPQLQKKLEELNQTWDVLNRLEIRDTEQDRVCQTMKMIAQQAEVDLQKLPFQNETKLVSRPYLFLLGLLFAMFAGYSIFNFFFVEDKQQMMNDLFIIEHLNQYRLLDEQKQQSQIDEIEFLKKTARIRNLQIMISVW